MRASTGTCEARLMRLHRILLPVRDIDAASTFYGAVFGSPGERVAVNRHYFDGGGVVVGLVDPLQKPDLEPLSEIVYFSMDEPLETVRDTWVRRGGEVEQDIRTQDWGETSFYGSDPWGNHLCFIAAGTEFSGGRFVR
jgi:catechol 2,3-dioxygenase-like lactoylglutathione lyase family enzyme